MQGWIEIGVQALPYVRVGVTRNRDGVGKYSHRSNDHRATASEADYKRRVARGSKSGGCYRDRLGGFKGKRKVRALLLPVMVHRKLTDCTSDRAELH